MQPRCDAGEQAALDSSVHPFLPAGDRTDPSRKGTPQFQGFIESFEVSGAGNFVGTELS